MQRRTKGLGVVEKARVQGLGLRAWKFMVWSFRSLFFLLSGGVAETGLFAEMLSLRAVAVRAVLLNSYESTGF